MVSVRFSSVTFFEPGLEATGYVIQAYDTDNERWLYLRNPRGKWFFTREEAYGLTRKIALKGCVDETRWETSYPHSDFEAGTWDDEQTKAEADGAELQARLGTTAH